jgi:hypothetical protein
MKNYTPEKVKPRKTSYTIGDRDVWGVECDVKFSGEDRYSRVFYVPAADALFRWMCDRNPQRFIQIRTSSLSPKRKAALLEAWAGKPKKTRDRAAP